MTPYLYPKVRHVRSQTPPAYVNYKKFKPTLRIEFDRKCVYCRDPDTVAPNSHGYGVDHYRPQNKFPELSADYGNLFYCCNACNAKKRDYWPMPSQITRLFIPNPCDHVMFEHLRFNGSSVVSRTEAGEFTSERLDLNEPARLKYRENLHLAIKVFEDRLHQYSNELNSLFTRIAEGSVSGTDAADVTDDLETQINGLQTNLDRWMGN